MEEENSVDIGKVKEEFIREYKKYISRDGSEELLARLEKNDFFTAPASTRHHDSCEGGLVNHSLNVFYNLIMLRDKLHLDYSDETIAIVGLLHDLCKVNYYTVSLRNAKNDKTGKWEKVPYYTVDDKFPFGHGEKSVFLISEIMELTLDEAMAIRWHMGAYEGERSWNTLSAVYNDYPLAFWVFVADMMDTYDF